MVRVAPTDKVDLQVQADQAVPVVITQEVDKVSHKLLTIYITLTYLHF